MSKQLVLAALLLGNFVNLGCATTPEDEETLEQEVLGPPSGVTLTPTSVDRLTVSWNSVPGALKYYIYQSTDVAGPFAFLGSARAPSTSLSVAHLSPNTTYCFEVRTEDGTGPGAFSAPVCTTSGPPGPTNVMATTSTTVPTTVNVQWNAVAGATKYYVYQQTGGSGSFNYVTTSLATTVARTQLVAGTTYCFRIAAQTATGSTAQSATACNAQQAGVNLGAAGNFVILAKSGVSTVPPSMITGDVGVSPAAASTLTGFSLTADPSNVFSTSSQVDGRLYAANYAAPTPANMTTAVGDMMTGFTDAAGRPAGVTELGAGNIGGMNLAPGVYKWGTGLLIPTSVTLTGTASDVWIFQIAQGLTMSSGAEITLAGGALARNVFWQVGAQTTLDSAAHLEGTVLGKTAIVLSSGATANGRLLSQTAVTLDNATVVAP